MPDPDDFPSFIEQLPSGLRAIVDAELAAGGTIVDAAGCYPAAPCGVFVRFKEMFRQEHATPAGVVYRTRPWHEWSAEYTDEKRHFFVIDTAPPGGVPLPRVETPPPPPVREEKETVFVGRYFDPSDVATGKAKTSTGATIDLPMSGYTCVLDFRGETLTYYENGRHLEMQCTWTRGYRIYTSSISDWVYDDRSGKPVTTEERDEIIRRVVSYARREQGVVMEVSD